MSDDINTSTRQNMDDTGSVLIPRILLGGRNDSKKSHKSENPHRKKSRKVWWIVGGIVAVILLFVLVTGLLAFDSYKKGMALRGSLTQLENSAKEQDLEKMKKELSNSKLALRDFKKSLSRLSFVKILPYIGFYVDDTQHGLNAAGYGFETGEIIIETIEPYADIIGFKTGSQKSSSGEQTTQERIDFIVKTIPELIPKADRIIEKAKLIDKELSYIDPEKYPEKIKGIEVQSKLKNLLDVTKQSLKFIENGKPLLEASPYLLGVSDQREYLMLFQNDKELRPTGGFLTAYTIAKVEKGRFEPVSSSDIYNLDSKYKPNVKGPDEFKKYLKGPYVLSQNYRLRDMNWSPDFSKSMELFMSEAKGAGIPKVDGVIAVDTQVLVNILEVIGAIDVPGFGSFSNKIIPECNCPQVIYELESFADIEGPVVWSQDEPGKIIFAPPNYDNRKKIIGPLMNSVLANALGQPKEKLPLLFEAVWKSVLEKHVLFFMFDEISEKALTDFGIGGTISDYESDYLHINDANLGGRKSNLYVTQEVVQEIEIAKDGTVTKTVTIDYKNPEKHDGWLNSVLPNWVRIYVPKGSELISFDGVQDKAKPYEEFGKTVFAGFFELRPQGSSKVTFKYKLPMKMTKEYKLLIQKQPGSDAPLYTIEFRKKLNEFNLVSDKEIKFKI